VAPKLTPIGLIGLTQADTTPRDEHRPLTVTRPPTIWRYARYALALAVPVGALVAMQRITEPEGFSAADTELSAKRVAPSRAAAESASASPTMPAPPAREFVRGAFGHSDAVRIRVVLPSEPVRLPIDFAGSTVALMAQWIGFDGKRVGPLMSWPDDGVLNAPAQAGCVLVSTLARRTR
jgi:hypothetical protein